MQQYGLVGLGNLGGKIADNLLKAGFPLKIHDTGKAKVTSPIQKTSRSGQARPE
ncbi:NAD(P)-binding domain-containing protein [Alphaproteobacteria bacterium LSUCC0684]